MHDILYFITSSHRSHSFHDSLIHSPTMPRLKYYQDDFRLTTWMLIGACLQACLFFLPIRLAIAPVILLLITRVTYFLMTRHGILPDTSFADVQKGRRAAQMPLPDGTFSPTPSDQDVVVMVLAAQSNQYVSLHSI